MKLFADNKSDEGHGRRALRSGAVSIVARAINAVVQIGSVLFLARLLSPEDYGLVGMVTAITGFASVFVDLGSRDAIVQRPQITEPEVSALFWMTQTVGLTLALAIAGSAPLIARFYGEPRLTLIAIVCALTFITAALTAQHYALMRRAMMFRELAVLDVVSNVLSSALAVGIALAGYHYWALVVRPIAAPFFLAIGTWIQCRWMPGRPKVTRNVRAMVGFGMHVTGFTMTDFIGKSGDRVAIGYRLGAAALGYYQSAMFIYDNLIDVVITPLHGVAVSSLSKLRDNAGELRRSWAIALSTLAFFAMPAFGLLSAGSRDVIVLVLGPKWAHSGVLLTILALRGMPHAIERSSGWLHVTAGRTDRWMRWGVVLAMVQLGALAAGLPFGPTGVVTAYVVVMFIVFIPAVAYAGAPLGIHARDVAGAVWRPTLGALAAVALTLLCREELLMNVGLFERTVAIGLVYLLTYAVIVVGVLRVRTPLRIVLSLADDYLPRRLAAMLKNSTLLATEGYEHI